MSYTEKLRVELKILSKIQENEKIKTTGINSIAPDDHYFRDFWRTFRLDSKTKSVDTVENIVIAVTEIAVQLLDSTYLNASQVKDKSLEKYNKEKREEIISQLTAISKDLKNSVKGVNNLSKTYGTYADTTSRLEQIRENIDTVVQKIDKKLASIHYTQEHNNDKKKRKKRKSISNIHNKRNSESSDDSNEETSKKEEVSQNKRTKQEDNGESDHDGSRSDQSSSASSEE